MSHESRLCHIWPTRGTRRRGGAMSAQRAMADEETWTDEPLVTVLGPTTVAGEPVTARQRAILAALVLHRRRALTTELLIDAVWSDDVPRAARQSLQNQITRLRRRFGADLVVTDGTGYRLGWATDVGRFDLRSEEHTSELQSLMRISYAVFCLKKTT